MSELHHTDGILMIQGTASDVGKSVIVTALCRIFLQDGYSVAPFKSQNMALNSYVTIDGREIGHAQGIQAEASGIVATTDMNPILIKPTGEMHSQIVVHGKPHSHLSAVKYREDFLPYAKPLVMEALGRLRDAYDVVVMEGAGSPAEINLKHRDIVNMNLAEWADAPVILVGDIDRGGVFAFLVGTLELLEPSERKRVKGFIINKFRGDISLLKPGLDWLEEKTGIPVFGVLPFVPDLDIEAEDSVVLDSYPSAAQGDASIDIAVIRYPRISNFTDFDILAAEPDVSLRYVSKASDLGNPDAIILPGTKDTIGDLDYVRELGIDKAIREQMNQNERTALVGICGGYQMLGEQLHDPEAVESDKPRAAQGLGWLPLSTTFLPGKTTRRIAGAIAEQTAAMLYPSELALPVSGYEIHAGETMKLEVSAALNSSNEVCYTADQLSDLFEIRESSRETYRREGVVTFDGRVLGTYIHGLFHNDAWRRAWLNGMRTAKGIAPLSSTFASESRKEAAFNRLADHVRNHIDMDQIYRLLAARH
ncbi:Cobyric acid synthase [compost metagenome]